VEHPLFGTIVRHGVTVQFSETPGRADAGCLIGQHTEQILGEKASPRSDIFSAAAVVMERDAFWLFLKLISGGYIAFAAAMLACLMKTTQPPVFSGRMVLQISCISSGAST